MNNDFDFGDLDDVEERPDCMPNAIYDLRSVEQEMNDTKDKTGSFLAVQFEVASGPMQGRKLFLNFNLINKNAQAVEIALRDIKSWLGACGLPKTGRLTMPVLASLEGKVFQAKVGVEKDKSGEFQDKNKIIRFIQPESGATIPAATAATSAAPTAAVPGANAKPWE